MLPMIVRFKVKQPGRRGFRLWFPVILIWLILAALMLVLLPFLLLAALITMWNGPGFRLLLIYPLLAAVLWNLGGLTIDVDQKESALLIDFI
ncbi:MAG: hypothetical protein PHI34_01400 [Acidobacteriota bacterium]|nr:hypothetical protein [Acidobacteriota bacterium]